MKSAFPTLLLLSALSFPALSLAQTAPPPPPPPASDYSPKAWKPFRDKEGKFSINFPEPPNEATQTRETPGGNIEIHVLRYKGPVAVLLFFSYDFPNLPTDAKDRKALFDRFREAQLKPFQSANPKIIGEGEISLAGNQGYRYHLELNGQQVIRIRIFQVGNRVYQLIVQTRKGLPNELEGSDDFEKIANGFFDSFQLTETVPATPSDTPKATPKE